jgi:hypothetical protein
MFISLLSGLRKALGSIPSSSKGTQIVVSELKFFFKYQSAQLVAAFAGFVLSFVLFLILHVY